MSNLKSILNSFHLKDELNPKIWKSSGNDEKTMNPKVRTHLLDIVYDFIESLDVDIIVSDIIMTGSLANYNWSNYSDVDIHIIADYQQFPKNTQELYSDLFHLKKTVYGLKHKITIFGYDVELYVEDESIRKEVQSAGRYSVLMDEWVVVPSKESVDIKISEIREKAQKWMSIIDGVEENIQDEDIETAKKLIKKYTTKIRKFRECGLEKDGEYSDENLVFKILRRNGYLEKIKEMKDKLIDKKLSLKESTTNIGGTFKTDLENGPKNHGGRALGNWQSDNAWDIFSPPGTVVNSYTEGVVSKIRDTGKNSGKIFGTQVSIKGLGEFPDIFYTHLKDVKLQKGDTVKVGNYIGAISEWLDHPNITHVHIGLPRGHHLKDLLVNSDKIFTGSKESTQTPSKETGETFLSDLDTISKSGKEFVNLKKPRSKIPYDADVEKIQTALQFLGYSLPKWGVDGLFGPETEIAVKSFETDNNISSDGKLSEEDLTKLFELLTEKGFKNTDLSKIQTTSDFNKVNVGNDEDFYTSILTGVGVPITDKKLSLKEENLNNNNKIILTSPLEGALKYNKDNSFKSAKRPNHHGVDFFATSGSNLKSPSDGVVIKAENDNGKCGGTLIIDHKNGFKSAYCHVKKFNVKKNDKVIQGQIVGLSGGGSNDEGRGNAQGAHLHFGLRKNDKPVDPMDYLDKSGIDTDLEIKNELVTKTEQSEFLEKLKEISKSGKEFVNLKKPGSKIPYDKDVEKIQTALQFLGYSLPKWGVDGLFGPETEMAVRSFESDNSITSDGKLSEEDLTKLFELLASKGFKESDLSKIQTTSDFDKINVGNDKDFYTAILTGVGAPITDENLKFFYAWRKSEGGKATNNPFNTTYKLSKDFGKTNYNKVGVKNYSTPNYGIEATVKTLLLRHYTCIVDGLKNDIGAYKISKCESLKTWGTGDLVSRVLSKGDVTPPKIYA